MTMTLPPQEPPPSTSAARPAEYMPTATALASLIARICAARILREHHIWEAVRILPQMAGLPENIKQSPELRRLMEKDAFVPALRLIAQSCQPARDFRDLDPHGDHWFVTLAFKAGNTKTRRKLKRAKHRDPPAAMLIALLDSAAERAKPFDRRKRTDAAPQKEICHD